MKQKLYFLLMLTGLLMTACSSDDDETKAPETISFEDYSSVIGMSYSNMIRKYPNPSMQFGDFYAYENPTENVVNLTIAINPDNQTVYMIVESLKEGAYKEEDIDAYFKSKFKSYGMEKQDRLDEDDNVVGESHVYTYGNADKAEDATLVITLTDNTSVAYMDTKNVPVVPDGPGLEDITPIEAVNALIMADLDEVEEQFPGVFSEMAGMYACFMEENEYLSGIAFTLEEGLVSSVIMLYNEDLADEDIINYYTQAGYTCTEAGTDEDGETIYNITNGQYFITYSAGRGVAVYSGELLD